MRNKHSKNGLLIPSEKHKELAQAALAGSVNFDTLPLDKLAEIYKGVETQYQMIKGKILLAARERFGQDDRAFGLWVRENGLDDVSQQQRYKYMLFAKHFSNRTITNLSPSVCMEIAAVMEKDRDFGMKLYNEYLGRNPTRVEIEARIRAHRGAISKIPRLTPKFSEPPAYTLPESAITNNRTGLREVSFTQPELNSSIPEEPQLRVISPEETILSAVQTLPYPDRISLLERCLQLIKEEKEKREAEFLSDR